MRTVKRYTTQDDELILKMIATYPNNITYALKLAGDKLGRTEKAMNQRYYKYLPSTLYCHTFRNTFTKHFFISRCFSSFGD